jgi:Fic family protein
MQPFMDGNGRTARAVEALMLQRSGLRDTAFIAMSNYYYDEKTTYLATLAAVRAAGHDLTAFLTFGLTGIALQCKRLYSEIRRNMQKALFKNTMHEMFGHLKSARKRVMGKRQLEILSFLLKRDEIDWRELTTAMLPMYAQVQSSTKTFMRDIGALQQLRAILVTRKPPATVTTENPERPRFSVRPNLDWPTEITETEFYRRMKSMRKSTSFPFLT